MSNSLNTNLCAIKELSKGNELAAQMLFRKNAQSSPNCVSLHNLGVYYIQYGMILKNGNIRSAKKLGLKYLLKAGLYGEDWRNDVSIATALLEQHCVKQAYQLFSRAYKQCAEDQILYNIGACLFRLEEFQEAIPIFKSLCTDNSVEYITKNGGQHPFLVLAFCQNALHNKLACINYLQEYRNIQPDESRLDVFYLRCLCGMYEDALSESQELLDEWYPTDAMLALFAECVTHLPSEAAIVSELIPADYKANWLQFISNSQIRSQKISEFVNIPPTICMYQFMV